MKVIQLINTYRINPFIHQVPWLPELFAMAEDMRVLDEMLADGGLKVGSEEVEAYKYNYRCNFTNITTGIAIQVTASLSGVLKS